MTRDAYDQATDLLADIETLKYGMRELQDVPVGTHEIVYIRGQGNRVSISFRPQKHYRAVTRAELIDSIESELHRAEKDFANL